MARTTKTKTCDFCGAKHLKTEMVSYEDKLLCDEMCKKLWIESYGVEEAKKEITTIKQ